MKTTRTIILSLAMFALFSTAKAQSNLLVADNNMLQAELDNSSIADLSHVNVRTYGERVYFKVNMRNGETPGVLILERSIDNGAFEVVKFKEMVSVTPESEILYCFNDDVIANKKVSYRVSVATADETEVLGTYEYGKTVELLITAENPLSAN